VDRNRVKDPLDWLAADLADLDRVVGHRLEDLESVPIGAAVLVNRHRECKYSNQGMRASFGRRIWGAVALPAAAFGVLVLAPAAQAAFGLNPLSVFPAITDAGAKTNLTINIGITDPEADIKDLTIHLPPGLIGNPQATTMCTVAQLNADMCPAATQVGTTSSTVNAFLAALPLVPIPLTVNGTIYNLVPQPGEPARFGIVLRPISIPPLPSVLPPIILQSGASLRQSDLGLDTVLNGLPRDTLNGAVLLDVTGLSLTLQGMAGTPAKPFIRFPTSCKTHTVGFDAKAYDNQTATGQATFTTTNCGALPFTPELSARIKRTGPVNEPVELSTTIAQTIEEAGLLRAQVVLPAGLGGNNDALANKCSQASFQAGNCPAASIVGSASATSPLLAQGLSGPVALVEPVAPGLPDIGIDLRGPLALKLKGTLGFTAQGRNIVVFDNLPDIPIAAFTLTFAGGPKGLVLPSRDVCAPPPLVFDANFLSHSTATLAATATATVDCSGGGGGGGGRGHKKPRAKIKLGHLGSDEPTMKLKIKAGSEKLRQAKLKLPRQLAFASGKDFDRGTTVAKVSVRHSARALKLKASKPAKRFAAKIAHGALQPGQGLGAHSKLKFKLKLRDAAGKTTKLTIRAK
jgi:hypothetical protein